MHVQGSHSSAREEWSLELEPIKAWKAIFLTSNFFFIEVSMSSELDLFQYTVWMSMGPCLQCIWESETVVRKGVSGVCAVVRGAIGVQRWNPVTSGERRMEGQRLRKWNHKDRRLQNGTNMKAREWWMVEAERSPKRRSWGGTFEVVN